MLSTLSVGLFLLCLLNVGSGGRKEGHGGGSIILIVISQLEEITTLIPFTIQVYMGPNLSALEFLETMQLNCNIFPNILN